MSEEITIQDCSTIERMERAINEYLFVGIEPSAIALGPHEYLSFREVEGKKLQSVTTCTVGTEPITVEMSFRGYPIFSIEIDGIHILGQRDAAIKSMWYRERNRLPFLMMGIKGENNK